MAIKNVDQVLSDRQRLGLTRLRTALFAALCLHLGVVAAVAVGERLGREEPEPIEFVPVRIVPAAALGSPDPPPKPEPQAPDPDPEPAIPEPEPDPEPAPPEPPPRPLRLDEVDVSMPPDPPPEPPRRRVQPPSQERPQRRGSERGNPLATSALGSQMGVDNPDFTYDYYLDRLLALIEARWSRPGDPPAQAVIHFRVHRDGSATEIEILEASGSSSFDRAALRAVQSATPFPPLPTSYRKDSLGVSLIVY